MSEEQRLQPESFSPDALPASADVSPALVSRAGPAWFQRLSSVLFVIFCFELGLFLVIYPWTDAWTENAVSLFAPAHFVTEWRTFWNNTYFRGAISGVGMANIWIALAEVFKMFARRAARAR